MELACTKKLLDYIGVKAEKASLQVDPLFGWTADLLVIDRRKTLVVVHAASRCAFVLYGLTVKDLRKLPGSIEDGVRRMLESEYVRADIIERYLDDLGREVTFRANSSPKVVANCNRVCQRVKQVSDLLRPGEPFQKGILPWLHNEILPKGGYTYAHEMLIGQLQERYGEDVRSCRAMEFEVSLQLHTPCKRRIVVPANLDLYQFHEVLQVCFGWHDSHLHQFVLEVDAFGRPVDIIQPLWDEMEDWLDVRVRNSMDVTLEEVFADRDGIIYEYDFGDGWIHHVELCRVIEDHREPYPQCIFAIGDAPMEDCGGPDGFAYVMKILNDPDHPEHERLVEWTQQMWWRRSYLDPWIKVAHRRLPNW